MIITRTPLRISFAGGGTDLPGFYEKEVGAVVSTSINKYVYTSAHPFFSNHIQLKYSKTEVVDKIEDIELGIFREALKLFGIENKIEISIIADLPKEGGSGLGGSTAFSVGLLNALSRYTGQNLSKMELAKLATRLEIDILGNPIGKQDQFASANGGLNYIEFCPDGEVIVTPIFLRPDIKEKLQNNLLVLYTGMTRSANNILADQQKNLRTDPTNKFEISVKMRDLARDLRDELLNNRLDNFGEILHENWLLKKQMSNGISCSEIDGWYERAMKAGAKGGKLMGAGGGGFLLFYVEPEMRQKVRDSLWELQEFDIRIESEGSKVILNE